MLILTAAPAKQASHQAAYIERHNKTMHYSWGELLHADSHEVVLAVVSLGSVHGSEALPTLLNPLRRKIEAGIS